MNGVTFYTGTRYAISPLDIAIVEDSGVTVRRPGPGNDTVYGFSTADKISGGGGNDAIWGLAGNDTLLGGDGNDTLHGGDGNDFVRGGRGDDALWGGPGNDVFAYSGLRDGHDTINDFSVGHDVLRIVDAKPSQMHVSDQADGTHLDLGGGGIVIAGLHGYHSVGEADAWLKFA